MQLPGRDISGMQQERSRRLCNQRGNVRRGLEDDNEAAGSKRNTGGKKCDLSLSSARKNQAFQENYMRIGVRKLLRMGWVPCDSVERTNMWHLARTQVGVEAAEGGSSRHERVSSVISFHEGERFGGWGGFIRHGHALLSGRRVDGQVEKRATEGVEEADLFKVQTWRTGERADRSRHVRDPRSWHPVAAVSRPPFLRNGGGGHENGLPTGRNEDAVFKKARIVCWKRWATKHERGVERSSLAGDTSDSAAKKDQRVVDRQPPQCDEVGRGRRTGAAQSVRHWLVGRKEMSWLQQRRGHRETLVFPLVRHGGRSETRSQRVQGAQGKNLK